MASLALSSFCMTAIFLLSMAVLYPMAAGKQAPGPQREPAAGGSLRSGEHIRLALDNSVNFNIMNLKKIMTNNIQTLILLTIFVPIVGSFTIPLAGLISKRARSFWSVLLALATTASSMLLIPFALRGGELAFRKTLAMGLDFIVVADGLSVFMAIASSFIGALIVIYSLGYIGHDENQSEYYLIVLLFIGAMMGLVFSANLIFMYLFWEIAAIACWRLIGFFRVREHVLKADKAFLVTFFGAVFMLLGFIIVYSQTGTFDLAAMRGTADPGHRRAADPDGHPLQVRHPAPAHLAARRRRGALPGHRPAARGGAGQDRRLRLRPPVLLYLHAARGLAAGHPDHRRRLQPGRRPRPPPWRPTSSASSPTPRSARSASSSSASPS